MYTSTGSCWTHYKPPLENKRRQNSKGRRKVTSAHLYGGRLVGQRLFIAYISKEVQSSSDTSSRKKKKRRRVRISDLEVESDTRPARNSRGRKKHTEIPLISCSTPQPNQALSVKDVLKKLVLSSSDTSDDTDDEAVMKAMRRLSNRNPGRGTNKDKQPHLEKSEKKRSVKKSATPKQKGGNAVSRLNFTHTQREIASSLSIFCTRFKNLGTPFATTFLTYKALKDGRGIDRASFAQLYSGAKKNRKN